MKSLCNINIISPNWKPTLFVNGGGGVNLFALMSWFCYC